MCIVIWLDAEYYFILGTQIINSKESNNPPVKRDVVNVALFNVIAKLKIIPNNNL